MAVFLWAGLLALPLGAEEPKELEVWFDAPAADWEREGLPIGNGAMGAVIQGGLAQDIIQFNDKTLWTGGPGSKQGYDYGVPEKSQAKALAEVRRELAQKGSLEPEYVAELLGREPKGYGNYQTFGNLVLDFAQPLKLDQVDHYRRALSLRDAVARVSYEQDGVSYRREYFASYPSGVIVVRLTASEPGKVSFRAGFDIPDNRSLETKVDGGRITVAGKLNDNHLAYEAQLQVLTSGGKATSAQHHVQVANADSAVLILTAGTNYALDYPDYRGEHPHAAIQARVDAATEKGYEELLREHRRDHRSLFDRLQLNIGQAMPDLPTPALLKAYTGSGSPQDKALENLYFQFGRYLLIASSRKGSLPANLQGVWNNSNTPPWNADYHVNINLQMNYWPADITNLSETAQPFFRFVEALVEPGRESAEKLLNARGWTLFLNTNPWGFTGVISWPTAFWQPEAGAWLAHRFYDHYLFTQDAHFLRERAYPVMKEAAITWLDALVEDPRDGSLVVSPSFSPEHGDFTIGAAMSQQLVFNLFDQTLAAAKRLGDADFARQLKEALARLDPGVRIGSWGQLQEWKADLDDPKDQHRHISQLFALYPGSQISPTETPALAKAAQKSLEARGDGGTGWAKAWKINLWARLLDGDRAHKLLSEQLKGSTLPNLWDTHPPFQIDGNFGATAGMAEMLVQSHNGELHLLPALPSAWSSGSVKGLRARGDLVVDMQWADGTLQEAVVTANHTGPVSVRSEDFGKNVLLIDVANGKQVRLDGEGSLKTFAAEAEKSYRLIPASTAKGQR